MSTCLDRKPIQSKPNRRAPPLLAISEITAPTFMIYGRQEFGLPTFILRTCLFHAPPLFLCFCHHEPSPQVVISRQTALRPTPLNGQCVIWCGNTTHAGGGRHTLLPVIRRRSGCDVRLLPDNPGRSPRSTKCDFITAPVGAEEEQSSNLCTMWNLCVSVLWQRRRWRVVHFSEI